MINVTTRIAVQIRNLPPFDFDWGDTMAQKPRESLTVDDILPSEADGEELFQRAVRYVMGFLIKNFSSLKHMKQRAADRPERHPIQSMIVPMPLLPRDEKYTDETICILLDFMKDCNLTGDPQVRVSSK